MIERIPAPKYLIIGEILRPHGILGELKMRVLTGYPERVNQLKKVYIGTGIDAKDVRTYHVQHMRMHHDYGLLKLREVPDRTAAEVFRELFVMVAMEDAVPLEEGEFYLFELVGLEVRDEAGALIGVMSEVLETGANDVYIIQSKRYGEVLIPVTDETILKTDREAGVITVRLPNGLLPDTVETDETE